MACRNGHLKVAALLIKHNANLNAEDSSGNTALHYASAYGWIECVSLLIQAGADPTPENSWKTTPITIAL
jgi:ankyrin repeat domain-containing protein 17